MVLYEIEHFNIYHEGESEKTLEDISAVLHRAHDVVVNFFEIEPETTDVYIYKDQVPVSFEDHCTLSRRRRRFLGWRCQLSPWDLPRFPSPGSPEN